MGSRRTSRRPKRTSHKPTKRTSRGLRANVIPPPPVRSSDLEDWALRTFAPDTRVRLRADLMFGAPDNHQDTEVFPAGTVGTVLGIAGSVLIVGVSQQRSMLFSTSTREYERTFGISPRHVQDTIRWLEPLDDNWGPQTTPMKRTSLPTSQRGRLSMKHRRLLPNGSEHSVWAKFKGSSDRDPALSEPEKDSLAKLIESEAPIDWTIDSEFSNRREPVHVSAWALFDSASKAMRFMAKVREWAEDYRVPVEVKSKSYKDDAKLAMKVVTVDDLFPRTPRLADPEREASIAESMRIANDVLDEMIASGELDEEMLERPQPPPRVESTRGRLSLVKKPRPNARRTSRRMRPNATCPSCGSPHYFEGPWNRDCAEPGCMYFRGRTIGGQLEAPPPVRPRPTGGRQILITYDTTTPESVAHGDYEDSGERATIDIEAEDLDEDETWAEHAASVIAKELGHVEDNGDGTYYQSDWSVTDYSTGEEERLAAHLHPPGAWAGDLDEIHELLKKRRLL